MARDDFSKQTIETLAKRASQRCSNPNCGCVTSGAHSLPNKAVTVGVAAHIAAASRGGPRHDASMTSDQRSAAENGIWLCESCAKLIDTDPARFSTATLHQWKAKAELASLQAIGAGNTVRPEATIEFRVTGWQMCRERGSLPGDAVIVISGWARGDVRYSCSLRFFNCGELEEQLHTVLVEWRANEAVLDSDSYAIQDDITLPPKRWVTVGLDHGLHLGHEVYEHSDSIWLSAIKASDDAKVFWKIAEVDHSLRIPRD